MGANILNVIETEAHIVTENDGIGVYYESEGLIIDVFYHKYTDGLTINVTDKSEIVTFTIQEKNKIWSFLRQYYLENANENEQEENHYDPYWDNGVSRKDFY